LLFNEIFKNHQLVIGSFIYGRNSNHIEISSQYPQFSKSFNLIRNDIKPDVINLLSRGWKYEFIQNDYDKSIQFYKSILGKAESSQIKGRVLNILGRLSVKKQDYSAATNIYQEILTSYPNTKLENGINLELPACLELSKAHLNNGAPKASLEVLIYLYEKLLKGVEGISEANYEFYLNKILEISGMIMAEHSDDQMLTGQINIIDSLNAVKGKLEYQTKYLLTFEENSQVVINTFLSKGNFLKRKRLHLEVGGKEYFFCVLQIDDESITGFLYEIDLLKDYVVASFSDPFNLGNNFILRDRDNEKLFEIKEISPNDLKVNVNFGDNLPAWSIELYYQQAGILESIVNTSSIYFYIFLLIMLILVFGLITTGKVVNQEVQLAKMKSDFISTVSHEFRSPLTSIRQMAEMIYHDRVVDPKKKKKYMEGILKESERLSHLIENILDFSRLEEGKKKFYFTNQSMDQLLLESITAFKNHVDPNNLTIQLIAKNKRLMVSVDKDAMMQVLNNLLDNAYKYSGDEKKIIVKSAIEDSFMKISIRDFGFGIPQDDQRKIFTRFYRGGEELTRSIRGTGIGLTIVKQIIEAHLGRIEVKSEIGKGSTFSFWIPITDN